MEKKSIKINVRESKYELLRIISMFMIIVYHIIVHGCVVNNTTGTINVLMRILEAIIIIHVNSFILVSGYYQCKSHFKIDKVVSLNNAAWFYRAIIMIVLVYFNVINIGKLETLIMLNPIDLGLYWFIDTYLILYCLSPFLNILINKMDKSTYQRLLFVMFLLLSILPSVTKQLTLNNVSGFSLPNFVFLYFLGAYFRLYSSKIWEYFKITSIRYKQWFFFIAFCACFMINFLLYFFGIQLSQLGPITSDIGDTITRMTYSYDNPFVIIGALMYFLWFGCLNINSRVINKISSLCFGIYLIHDNQYFRQKVYSFFGLQDGIPIHSYNIFMKVLLLAIGIFIGCAIIEWFRQLLFKFFAKRKISQKIRLKWYQYVESFKNFKNNV